MKKQMKGLVLSFEGHDVVVLTPDGQYVRVKKPNAACAIGMEISFEVTAAGGMDFGRYLHQLKARLSWLMPKRPLLQGAMAVVLVGVMGVGSWAYPAGQLYMDVNPSVGLTYNVYHRIIKTESYNADGAKVIAGLKIYGKPLAEGVTDTFKAIDEKGFLKDGEDEVSNVVLGYTDAVVANEAAEAIGQVVETVQKPVNMATVAVKPQTLKQAEPKQTPVSAAIEQQKEPPKPLKIDRVEKVKQKIEIKKAEKKRLEAEQAKPNETVTKPEILEKPIKPEKTVKTEKVIKPEKNEKPLQPAKPEKPEKPEKQDKQDKPDGVKAPVEQPSIQKQFQDELEALEKLILDLQSERDAILSSEMGKKEMDKQLKRIDKKLEQLEKRLNKLKQEKEQNITGS